MARPRRLRYKLMLGLGLVVGSVVLLVVGTVYGIRAYTATVKTTERKMLELQLATNLVETLKGSDKGIDQFDPTAEVRELELVIQATRVHLEKFREANNQTVALSLDPDGGAHESGLANQLEAELNLLQTEIRKGPGAASDRTILCGCKTMSARTTRPPAALPSNSASF